MRQPLTFTIDDAERAHEIWGANCGPAALAAVLGLTLDDVRPHIPNFDSRRYTNPSMMAAALSSLGVTTNTLQYRTLGIGIEWPIDGLARIQWEGSWMNPGVPVGAQYAKTHWVGVHTTDRGAAMPTRHIFDVNCMVVGGWVPLAEWSSHFVPWLWKQLRIKATGWHVTHAIEIRRPS